MQLLLLALAAGLALGPQRPDSVVIPRGDLMRLYTDCSEARWPYGTD